MYSKAIVLNYNSEFSRYGKYWNYVEAGWVKNKLLLELEPYSEIWYYNNDSLDSQLQLSSSWR